MIIEGVSNPSGGVDTSSMIVFNGTGAGTFWNFDSPDTGGNNGFYWTVRNLYLLSADQTYAGRLISSSTSVTDGSKITSGFTLKNCFLSQGGGASSSCILLDIGKS